MEVRVSISYIGNGRLKDFPRKAWSADGGGALQLQVVTCGRGTRCEHCYDRRHFIKSALSESGVQHSWDEMESTVTFPDAKVTTPEQVTGYLKVALPTATDIVIF